jgi:hypothetical protein
MSEHGPLDLGDADVRGFAPIDPGRYNAEIVELTWDATKNAGGKTPVGTPMLKVQFRVLNPQIDGEVIDQDRRAFTQFVNPPKDYDPKKRATMQGMIARFFMALGFTEDEVKSGSFNPDFAELQGTPCVVTLGREQKRDRDGNVVPDEWNNPVKNVKAAGTLEEAAGAGLL